MILITKSDDFRLKSDWENYAYDEGWIPDVFDIVMESLRLAITQKESLLDACKSGEELLALICEVICIGNPPPQGVERIANMRAAIAKAEGRDK